MSKLSADCLAKLIDLLSYEDIIDLKNLIENKIWIVRDNFNLYTYLIKANIYSFEYQNKKC